MDVNEAEAVVAQDEFLLSLDFNQLDDAAAWASLLRDQYLELQRQHRELLLHHEDVVQAMDRRNMQAFWRQWTLEIIPAAAVCVFPNHPFASLENLHAIPDPESLLALAVVDLIQRQMADTAIRYGQDVAETVRELWDSDHHEGLGGMVHDALVRWRDEYLQRIVHVIEELWQECPIASSAGWVQDLWASTELGSPMRGAFYQSMHPVLVNLFAGDRGGTRATTDPLLGQRIRDICSAAEEAWILLVTRKCVLRRFGSMIHDGRLGQDGTDRLPEVSRHAELQPQDLEYYAHLLEMLEMQDCLAYNHYGQDDLVMIADHHDILSVDCLVGRRSANNHK